MKSSAKGHRTSKQQARFQNQVFFFKTPKTMLFLVILWSLLEERIEISKSPLSQYSRSFIFLKIGHTNMVQNWKNSKRVCSENSTFNKVHSSVPLLQTTVPPTSHFQVLAINFYQSIPTLITLLMDFKGLKISLCLKSNRQRASKLNLGSLKTLLESSQGHNYCPNIKYLPHSLLSVQ